MPRELKNAVITHVSLVDKGANKKQFAIIKSDKQPMFQKQINIIKSDEEKQLVTGIVYEPDVPDSHDDFMTAEEIEKAAHQFLQDYRQIDKQHNFQSGYGEVVESYVAKSEHAIGDQVIQPGTWVMTVKVNDADTWEAIKKGEITGFSMAGIAEVIEKKSDEKPVAKSEEDEARGFFQLVKDYFAGRQKVQKGEMADRYNKSIKVRNFWAAMDSFESVIRSYNWTTDSYEFETDEEKIREALADFQSIIESILLTDNVVKAMGPIPENIAKAGKKISSANMDKINAAFDALQALKESVEGEEVEVTKEELQEIIKGELTPLAQRIEALEKAATPANEPKEEPVDTAAEIAKQVKEVLKVELEPISQRLEVIEKARGVSKAADNDDTATAEPVQKSVFGSLFGQK
jgi:hypothetical protein